MRTTVAIFLGLVVACGARAAHARKHPALLRVPLLVRIARCGPGASRRGPSPKAKGAAARAPTRSAAWVKNHVAAANRLYKHFGVELVARIDRFRPSRCQILTRAHRHALARHVPAGGVTVLVMPRVRDVDTPTYNLMGVHWRYHGKAPALRGRRWVFLTARGRPPVLAHELGHYFGLRHDKKGGNLMTPGPSDPIWNTPGASKPKPFKPIFVRWQQRVIRRSVKKLLARPKRAK